LTQLIDFHRAQLLSYATTLTLASGMHAALDTQREYDEYDATVTMSRVIVE
jgi:hypothetical protein